MRSRGSTLPPTVGVAVHLNTSRHHKAEEVRVQSVAAAVVQHHHLHPRPPSGGSRPPVMLGQSLQQASSKSRSSQQSGVRMSSKRSGRGAGTVAGHGEGAGRANGGRGRVCRQRKRCHSHLKATYFLQTDAEVPKFLIAATSKKLLDVTNSPHMWTFT